MAESRPEDIPEGAAPAAAAPPKKSKKMLFIIIGAVVALLAIGGATYAFVSKKGDDTEQAADPKAKGKSKHVVAKKETKPKEPAIYTAFDPPFVVNFQAKASCASCRSRCEVMTRDPETAEMFKQHDPDDPQRLADDARRPVFETLSTPEGKEKLRTKRVKAVANDHQGRRRRGRRTSSSCTSPAS